MIIMHIRKFFYRRIKFRFRAVIMLIDSFRFQCIEISLHWCIIIRISGFAHALGDSFLDTEFCELPGCVLASLIRCDIPIRDTCNNTPVIQVYNGTVITLSSIRQG